MARSSVADTYFVCLWQPLLEECMKRAAAFICQEKVFLEGLKPFGRLEAINFSGYSFSMFLFSVTVNISNVWIFFYCKEIKA